MVGRARQSPSVAGALPQAEENMMKFDGEARFRRDRVQRSRGYLRREGFQPARRHPSAARHRYQQRAHTDDELDDESYGGVRRQGSNEYFARVRGQNSSERIGGVRREFSNENLDKPEAHGHRSLSAPPVRTTGAVVPDGSAEQVSRVSTEMKMARAASAAQYITSQGAESRDADVFAKAQTQDLYAWLKTISLQEYLPVLLQMGVERIIHLADLEEEDVQEAGMTRPERKRFLRKKAELAFDDTLSSMNRPVTSEHEVEDLGEQAFGNVSDPESSDRPKSAQESHRSQISVISAASSCLPLSDKDDSGSPTFSSPSLMQPQQTKTVDLAALEQHARAVCRIYRISDDCALGFGFIHKQDGRSMILTCLDVLGSREDAAKASAVFSDGEILIQCRLDADTMWYQSDDIGYCAVGTIFDAYCRSKVPSATVSKGSCKCDENIVVCHWGEVDKQFTIHKVSSVSSRNLQFPVRGGLQVASGTPVFSGNLLMGMTTSIGTKRGYATAVCANAMILDVQQQYQATCDKVSTYEEKSNMHNTKQDTANHRGTEISGPLSAAVKSSAFVNLCSPDAMQASSVAPPIPGYTHQQGKLDASISTTSLMAGDSNARKDVSSLGRRPPRPVNTLPCVSLPCMSSGAPSSSNSRHSSPTDTRTDSLKPSLVRAFNIVPKLDKHEMPRGVALSFQDQDAGEADKSACSETPMLETNGAIIMTTTDQAPVVADNATMSPSGDCAQHVLERCEEALSQNDTDEQAHENQSQLSGCIVEIEPLSARSHHEPQADSLSDAADAADVADAVVDQNAEVLVDIDETKGVLSALLNSSVKAVAQILNKHEGCPAVVHAAFQRLDELCNDSQESRREAMHEGIVNQVLNHLNTCVAGADLHASGLSLLSSLSFDKELQLLIFQNDGIGTILRNMQMQQTSAKIQFRGCRALCNIGYESEQIQLQMVGQGCIPVIVSAMKRFLSSSKVQGEGCGVLCNLSANNDSNFKLIIQHGGLSAIVQAMSMHGSQLGVLYKGCCALCSLTTIPDSHSEAMDAGAASTVIKSMLMHPDDFELLYKGCGVLANLAQTPKFAATIAKQGGVAAIVKGAMTGPASDVRLQCKGLRALYNLCKTGETQAQIDRQGAVEATIEVMMMNQREEELQEKACAILSRIVRHRPCGVDNWQHRGVEAVLCAMQAHSSNQIVVMEGSAVLSMLALYEGAKDRILEASILPHIKSVLKTCKVSATVYSAVRKLERALHPLDSFLADKAPDTIREMVRQSKNKGDVLRPISAAVSRPPRPMSAAVTRRSRRPASASFASGSGAMLVKDLRRGLGKENDVDRNLLLQHEIEALRNQAEFLRHENLKMMSGAAESITALRDVHGVRVHTTVKRRPASAMMSSPYTALSAVVPMRPPSGKSIRVSKEIKGKIVVENSSEQHVSKLQPLKLLSRPGSAPALRLGLPVCHMLSPEQKCFERDSEILQNITRLIATGRTNEQVARHFSLVDFGISVDEVEACRQRNDATAAC